MIISQGPTYKDQRGTIEMLIENMPLASVSRITSVAGSVRANHIHFDDYHVCLMVKGEMNYYERDAYSEKKPTKILIKPGDLFYTVPKKEHAMEFITDSEFLCFSKHGRTNAAYEGDTVKLAFDLTKE